MLPRVFVSRAQTVLHQKSLATHWGNGQGTEMGVLSV